MRETVVPRFEADFFFLDEIFSADAPVAGAFDFREAAFRVEALEAFREVAFFFVFVDADFVDVVFVDVDLPLVE